MRKKEETEEKEKVPEKEHKPTTIEPTNTWINKTSSKRGFIIYVKDDLHEGDILLGGIAAMQEFIDGERTGINLGMMVEVEDEE